MLSGPSMAPSSGGAPASLVVMLHGRGSNGDDLIGLAGLFREEFPHTAFHSPNAPLELAGFGYEWYPLDPREERPGHIRRSEVHVNEFVDSLLDAYGLASAQCALLGFSQGTIMSIHTAPRRASQLAGVVGFSGAMYTGDTLEAELASKPPFVLIHGAEDPVLSVTLTEEAGRNLDELGVPVSVHVLPGLAHSIDRRAVDIAIAFLKQVLPAS
jgi:phospholipase/carboxylesterase